MHSEIIMGKFLSNLFMCIFYDAFSFTIKVCWRHTFSLVNKAETVCVNIIPIVVLEMEDYNSLNYDGIIVL